MSTLYFTIRASALDRALLARGLDFVVIQAEDGPENFFGVLAEQRRAPDVRRRIRQLDRIADGQILAALWDGRLRPRCRSCEGRAPRPVPSSRESGRTARSAD